MGRRLIKSSCNVETLRAELMESSELGNVFNYLQNFKLEPNAEERGGRGIRYGEKSWDFDVKEARKGPYCNKFIMGRQGDGKSIYVLNSLREEAFLDFVMNIPYSTGAPYTAKGRGDLIKFEHINVDSTSMRYIEEMNRYGRTFGRSKKPPLAYIYYGDSNFLMYDTKKLECFENKENYHFRHFEKLEEFLDNLQSKDDGARIVIDRMDYLIEEISSCRNKPKRNKLISLAKTLLSKIKDVRQKTFISSYEFSSENRKMRKLEKIDNELFRILSQEYKKCEVTRIRAHFPKNLTDDNLLEEILKNLNYTARMNLGLCKDITNRINFIDPQKRGFNKGLGDFSIFCYFSSLINPKLQKKDRDDYMKFVYDTLMTYKKNGKVIEDIIFQSEVTSTKSHLYFRKPVDGEIFLTAPLHLIKKMLEAVVSKYGEEENIEIF